MVAVVAVEDMEVEVEAEAEVEVEVDTIRGLEIGEGRCKTSNDLLTACHLFGLLIL